MNKYLFIFGLVCTALFPACSSEELAVDNSVKLSPEEEKSLVIEAGKESEIPIMFGSVGSKRYTTTRAIIPSDENGLFETPLGEYMGVFCLATGKQNESQMINSILPATSAAINWSSHQYANWLNNVPAVVVKYDHTLSPSPIAEYVDEDYSAVIFKNPGDLSQQKYYYYPFGNWYHYNFYAYYPRVETPTIEASNVYADYTITGKEDIIQGVASRTDNTYILENALPFSAKYFRLKNNGSLTTAFSDLPGLALEHKLAKIVVVVKAHDATHAAALAARHVELTNAGIEGVYKNLRLCVASKSSSVSDPTGQLTIQDGAISGTLPLWKVADDGNPFNNGSPVTIPITAAETEVGYTMIPPSALLGTNEKYMINLAMQQDGGAPLPDFPVVLENTDGSSMTFLAGHSYTITLDIYSPSEIYVTATLNNWVPETTTITVD